jgi:ribosomal protein S5
MKTKAIMFPDMVQYLVDIRDELDERFPGRMIWVKNVQKQVKKGVVVSFSITLETPDGDRNYLAMFAK